MDGRTSVGQPAGPRRCFRRRVLSRWSRVGDHWRLCLLAALLLAAAGPVEAQPSPRVDVRVSADSVKIGERFAVILVAEHAQGSNVVFPGPDAGPGLFGDLEVFRRGEVQGRQTATTRRVDSVAYEVATFALDSARVPVLPVRVADGPDTTVVGTVPRVVPVISVVGPNAEGLRTPALLASFPRPLWVWATLGLVAATLLGGLVYAWWRRGSASEAVSPDQEEQDPYEAASARLRQLERRNPNDRESCKAFYVDLTETLRVYLAQRVGVRALECTTPELVAALRRRADVPDKAADRIQEVLGRADLVKFAVAQPRPEESRAVLKEATGVLDTIEAAQRRAETPAPADEVPSPA